MEFTLTLNHFPHWWVKDTLITLLSIVTLFGKSRLNENSVEAFFRCNAFSTHWKSVEEHFHCVSKHWQRSSTELKCVASPFANHLKTLSMRFQTLTTRSIKAPAVWNHFIELMLSVVIKSLQRIVNSLAWTLARQGTLTSMYVSVWIWAETSNAWSFPMAAVTYAFWLQFLRCWKKLWQ